MISDASFTLSDAQITALQLENPPMIYCNIAEPLDIVYKKPFKTNTPYKIWEKGAATISTIASDELAAFITAFCDKLKKEFNHFEIKTIPPILKTVGDKKNIINIKCREITNKIAKLEDGSVIPCQVTVYFNPAENKAGLFFNVVSEKK